MFVRNKPRQGESFSSRYGAGKSVSKSKKHSFRDHSVAAGVKRAESSAQPSPRKDQSSDPTSPNLTSAIITLVVGPDQRLFAAHEDVLCNSSFFQAACRGQFLESHARRINLPEESPEILSSVLEFLYKGDYYPKLLHNKRKDTWELEDRSANGNNESTIYHHAVGGNLLKDTVIYCAALRYDLPELGRLALRKQGLQSGIQVSTILSSARYAYAQTPDTDSKLRAHYLALIIRSKNTFKRSGTMQMEMEEGGRLFFDLFVAMCNHIDDLGTISRSPFTR
ncbi:hypothetical protein EPUS_02437 [Endocarpon pusillum Z07020]|uniref:BTB domain-containing protein n=1 Tax=Endocarpon pusillum (strain Z07020 / HMAS-L-300199) TaxID=1263415 RepID=U1HPC7_ENDPU|nr:uncharacterized protein EPUS_02437 [Endocarpon pusillum Z07020]ERF70914.1 hypothetical protein EPUS_02437 [Endocarpon pusillum Z07020]